MGNTDSIVGVLERQFIKSGRGVPTVDQNQDRNRGDMFRLDDIRFDPDACGTPNPGWTKKKLCRRGRTFNALADHICRRTPPRSFGVWGAVFDSMVRRNRKVLDYWAEGYELLTNKVVDRLVKRDGSL